MTTASAIPAAIDALVSTATTALGTTAEVIDGPGAYDAGERGVAVYIGANDPGEEDGTPAASSAQEWAWLGHVQRKAEFTVDCHVVAWNGDADQKAARDAAFTALQAFTDAITSDPTLGGVVIHVTGVSGVELVQSQDSDGAHAHITFGLPMAAWLA